MDRDRTTPTVKGTSISQQQNDNQNLISENTANIRKELDFPAAKQPEFTTAPPAPKSFMGAESARRVINATAWVEDFDGSPMTFEEATGQKPPIPPLART